MSAGSCFAANIRRFVERHGLEYTVTESAHPMFPHTAENAYYDAYSARYGNVYTARQMHQLLSRAQGTFQPVEDRWIEGSYWIDPFRPGLRHPASSEEEFELMRDQHLAAVRKAVEVSTVFIFTLGLTETWASTADGAVFPACPGTIAGTYDARRHQFLNLNVSDVVDDLLLMIERTRELNPTIKIILTVSPVPLVATATTNHVLTATTYSKAVLRAAAEVARTTSVDVAYFPAYDLVMSPQADDPFEDDRRSVREATVAAVMDAFFACFIGEASHQDSGAARRSTPTLASAGRMLLEAECEEEALERWAPKTAHPHA